MKQRRGTGAHVRQTFSRIQIIERKLVTGIVRIPKKRLMSELILADFAPQVEHYLVLELPFVDIPPL